MSRKSLRPSRRLQRSTIALCLALGTHWAAGAAVADPVNFEGTWKIAAPQTSFKPEGAGIPFTAEGRERFLQNKSQQAKGDIDSYDHAIGRCASPGLPRLMLTPKRFRIWQRRGEMLFEFEWNRLIRQVDLGHLFQPQLRVGAAATMEANDEAGVGRAVPVSKGHWDRATLVVTTDGFIDNTLVDDLVPHGYNLKLTERLRLKDPDTLEDRITIEDPDQFTQPWDTVVTYKRQPDSAFPEDVCLERLQAGKKTL